MPKTFICTVHIGTDRFWLDTQQRFLARHAATAHLAGSADPGVCETWVGNGVLRALEGTHAEKLDELAAFVTAELAESDEDVLVFLDGDAFPIRDLDTVVADALRQAPLAAICRRENGEDYPHPSFCVTTVGFWRDIKGTWAWSSVAGPDQRNDIGCQLRDDLRAAGVQWLPILRSNHYDPHPLMFGVYGDAVYHHGAGFRRPLTALDRQMWREHATDETWTSPQQYQFFSEVVATSNRRLSDLVKQMISTDDGFVRVFG